MRTTLDIDDDLLQAAKELARLERASAGAVVSRLLREALTGVSRSTGIHAATPVQPEAVAGFLPFPAKPGVIITQEHVNAVRDQEGV
ncbi:MAG: type II toxin-antitoxin system VapB family antitoxin [Burkholderiaceae bacterium]|nr:type II toxin-antitoxin system VapB family antitoxin [Roseateles sp.]MBV8469220.1 type II toxin-antitoxin system VapB family antitoxin [Burkholderiaceae bacterium]